MNIKKYISQNRSNVMVFIVLTALGAAIFIRQILNIVLDSNKNALLMAIGVILMVISIPVWKSFQTNISQAKALYNPDLQIMTYIYKDFTDTIAYAEKPGIAVIGQKALLYGSNIYTYSGAVRLKNVKLINGTMRKIMFYFEKKDKSQFEIAIAIPDELRSTADEVYAKIRMKING